MERIGPTNRLAALFALAFLAASAVGPTALAQRVPEHGLRLSFGLDLGNGRMPLLPTDGSDRPKAREAFAIGGRFGLDAGLGPRFALELSFSSNAYIPRDLAVFELGVVPRIRFLTAENRRELYIRPLIGAAFIAPSDSHAGLAAGLGFGIRRQMTPTYDAFLEVGYRVRWMPAIDADFAATTWPSYGLRSGADPNALLCFLGVTMGIGMTPSAR